MTGPEYMHAVRLSTMAAIKGGVSLPEMVGVLEIAKQNVMRNAEKMAEDKEQSGIKRPNIFLPPGGLPGGAG